MSDRQPLPTAPSASFRRKGAIERAGERFREAGASDGVRVWLKHLYHSALMLRTLGRGLRSALPHGEVVRVHPANRFMSWNPDEYEAFRAVVRPGMVALDVGANVGSYALLLGQWVGPRGKVFAFEPAPSVFAGLVGHIALNHLGEIVRPVAAAVGDRDGTAGFSVSPVAGESRLAGLAEPGADTVPVTTIDSFCLKEDIQPGFIKIDVEGWELAALRGARQTIRRCGEHLALFVEMHPSIWPLLGVTRDDVLAELKTQSLAIAPLRSTTDVWATEGECVRLIPSAQPVTRPT